MLNNNSSPFSYLGILVAIIGWGLSATFISFGLESINPYFFLSLRFFLAVLLFFPYILIFKRKVFFNLLVNRWIWIIAFFEFLGLELQYYGQLTVSASLATLLSIQFVIFVPFLSSKLLNDKFSKITVVSVIIALTGTIFISSNGNFTNLISGLNIGVIFLLFSALAFAFYIIFSSKFTNDSSTPIDGSVLFFNIILGVAIFSLIPTITLSHSFTVSNSVWIWIIALAVFSTLIPFFGYFKGLQVISANSMSLVLLLQIIVPFVIDIVFLGVTYSAWIIIGSLLVISSLVIFVVKPIFDHLKLESKFNKINVNIAFDK